MAVLEEKITPLAHPSPGEQEEMRNTVLALDGDRIIKTLLELQAKLEILHSRSK